MLTKGRIGMPNPEALRVHKIAGDDGVQRVTRYHPETGEKFLASAFDGKALPRPLVGVKIENDGGPPKVVAISTGYANREDWIELVGARPQARPAGPADDPWKSTHLFLQADEIILHTIDGDVRYRVTRQPDKYDDATGEPTDAAGDPATSVVWEYTAELVEG